MILFLKFLAAFATAALLTAAEDIGPIELVPVATSGTEGVLLSDLAGKNGITLPKIVLGPAPAVGRPIILNRFQIIDLLAKNAPEYQCAKWIGAERVRVVRATRIVDETMLKDLLTGALQEEHVKERGELELRLTRPWNNVAVPDEVLSVRVVELPTSGVSPNFICRFDLQTAGETAGTYQVPLQARIWRDVYVARSGLTRGQLLRDADIALERRDLLSTRDFLTEVPVNDPYVELRENVRAGMPLTARAMRLRAIIKRGRMVDALFQDDTLTISVRAEALEDGIPGQMVRVRNLRSKREFKGKVLDEQTVSVMF
jgi:flagella basal body P-ring formation protein FlgA